MFQTFPSGLLILNFAGTYGWHNLSIKLLPSVHKPLPRRSGPGVNNVLGAFATQLLGRAQCMHSAARLNSDTLTQATRVKEEALQFPPQYASLLKISHISILTPAAPPVLASVGGLAFLVQEYLEPLYSVCSAPLNTFAINQRNIWQRVGCCERYLVHLDLISPHFVWIMMRSLPLDSFFSSKLLSKED